jgi:glycosyltransferase involved in cell wall biosynthesis
MRCLWLTLADPEPASNGQLLYSKGLIEAAAQAGLALTVIGLARPEHPRYGADPRGIDWRFAQEVPRNAWQRLLSPYPAMAQPRSPELHRQLACALAEQSWDAVIFDSICTAWALPAVLQFANDRRPGPRLVYIAHNHEMTVARHLAGSARGLRRLQRQLDRLKTIALEHRLLAAADVVTSNTPDDRAKYIADSGRDVLLLPPGYDGPRVLGRTIDNSVPRRAILVGSLDWPVKRLSVEAFLEAAAIPLAQEGVQLQLVGEAEHDYLGRLRRRFPSVDFVGRVADVGPYLQQARLALVPDQIGGFKLKGLDYVFHRLPILAMRVALPGMPLEEGRSVALFDSHQRMAQGVLSLIDDFATLNAWQERAYAACSDKFNLERIGRDLRASIEQAGIEQAGIEQANIEQAAGSPAFRVAAGAAPSAPQSRAAPLPAGK